MRGTTIRAEIRRLTRSGGSRPICPVRVETIEPLTPRFSRVVVQGDGLAITWLTNTRPGDTVVLLGMRREFHAGDVDHHLLIGDSTSLPAIASIVESLDVPSTVFLQAETPDERALVPGDVQWIHSPPAAEQGLDATDPAVLQSLEFS